LSSNYPVVNFFDINDLNIPSHITGNKVADNGILPVFHFPEHEFHFMQKVHGILLLPNNNQMDPYKKPMEIAPGAQSVSFLQQIVVKISI